MIATLRETNKADKLKRIREAAHRLFSTQGFDKTSTRDIASEAGVGLATLFLYADDKRDLLFLAANDDLEHLTDRAFAGIRYSSKVSSQLIGFFRCFFEFYAKNRLFSRDLLRELTFFTTGRQSARFLVTRRSTINCIEHVLRRARERGAIKKEANDSHIAEVVFYVFAADVRRWLGQDESSTTAGVEHLRTLLEIILVGNENG